VSAQRLAHALGEDAAAPQRDHVARARVAQEPAHELLLGRSERRLAVQLELAGHRVAEAGFEQGVAVEWVRGAPGCELRGDRRLAGPHEADQDERHPIRLR